MAIKYDKCIILVDGYFLEDVKFDASFKLTGIRALAKIYINPSNAIMHMNTLLNSGKFNKITIEKI